MDFIGILNSENRALGSFQSASGVHFKVSRGSIESAPWFIWQRIKWTLVHSQLNHDSFWNEPRRTLKWTKGLIIKVKKPQKNQC